MVTSASAQRGLAAPSRLGDQGARLDVSDAQPDDAQPDDAPEPTTSTWLRRVRLVLLVAYGVAYLAWFLEYGVIIDRISVGISVAVFLAIGHIGKPWSAWRALPLGLLLYAAMWFAYDETRGAADQLGMPLQVESVRNIDRVMFLGADPVVWLQRTFLGAEVRYYDVIASVVYFSHFVVPVAAIAILWITNQRQWIRFMRRFATVLAIACVMFILLPTAPPWMAAGGDRRQLDALPPLRRTSGNGWRHLGFDGFIHVWVDGRDWTNTTAAMPSLHAAFSLFVVAFFWQKISRRWLRLLSLTYPLVMGISLVYLGEHYVIDVLAGWAVVGLSFWMWARFEQWLRRRRDTATIVDDSISTETAAAAEAT